MRNISWFLLLFIGWLCACNTTQQPNIIVILADDAGYSDFGFMGCTDLETPNLDKLAGDGVVFTDAHVSATVCAPSRAGLLSGKYQQRFGFECNIPPIDQGIAPSEPTIGNAMQEAGYKTIAIGKWHVGESEGYHPNARGFDEFYGFLGGSRSYFMNNDFDQDGNPHAILHNKERIDFTGYLTDIFGDQAVNNIKNRNKQPFFMYVAFNAVHTPMDARKEDLEKYKGHPRQKLAAMTWSLDQNVGKIIDQLKKEEIYDNTLIFFLSDNGAATNNQASSKPLKGWKGNKYEGGHRVPFTVSWPNQILKGGIFSGLSSSLDIYATCLDVAGLKNNEKYSTDGTSLIPFLKEEFQGDPHEKLYWRKDQMAGMRYGSYKLIRLEGYGHRLYNLDNDLGETIDLCAENKLIEEQMMSDLEQWESKLLSPLWLESKEWSDVTYEIHRALMENREPHYTDPAGMKAYRQATDAPNHKIRPGVD